MVLLNFLLAIIVDAFSEVKEKTTETVSAPMAQTGCNGAKGDEAQKCFEIL